MPEHSSPLSVEADDFYCRLEAEVCDEALPLLVVDLAYREERSGHDGAERSPLSEDAFHDRGGELEHAEMRVEKLVVTGTATVLIDLEEILWAVERAVPSYELKVPRCAIGHRGL